MRAVNSLEMRAAEDAARAAGWTEADLLAVAGTRLGRALGRLFPAAGTAIGYLGKGHNAGDALVALGILRDEFGWRIACRSAFPASEMAQLTAAHLARVGPEEMAGPPSAVDLRPPLLLLDGLVGMGARGSLRGPVAALAEEINSLRASAGSWIAAIDLPSGIDPDTGASGPVQIIADVTFQIANAKVGLLRAEAAGITGSLALVPLAALAREGGADTGMICPQNRKPAVPPRPYGFHKGMAGRVSIIAGSAAYTGAAVLCATGCLRAGAGLVTLHVPPGTEAAIATRCPPEIIVRAVASPADACDHPADVLVIGCGLGPLDEAAGTRLLAALAADKRPAVLDADLLNLIAARSAIDALRPHHVLTPHPGEFARLAPDLAGLAAEDAVHAFCRRSPATLLLKGARTLIGRSAETIRCNSTGHPGMATGGQGDLLAGVIGALLAAGHDGPDAAALAAWLCGRAAESAVWNHAHSAESLTPSDVAAGLGPAFSDWRRAGR